MLLLLQVLTTGWWPSFNLLTLQLPTEMAAASNLFVAFYNQKTQHRKLQWIHSQGTGMAVILLFHIYSY